MLHLARVEMLTSNRLKKTSTSEATAELDSAKDLLGNAIRFELNLFSYVYICNNHSISDISCAIHFL